MSAELQQSRNSCSGRRPKLREGCIGRGPCCATERACMPGYISSYCHQPAAAPERRPALNEFEPKRLGRRVEKLHNGQLRAIHPLIYVPLVCRHSRRLSVFVFNAHIWQL